MANETREGDVFQKLFDKLEVEKKALGGKVFDILGEAFENQSLKELLVEAIRYGESPEVKARLNQVIEGALDTEHLKDILKRNALVEQHMSLDELYAVKEEMEKAEARKLQPYFIRSFFTEAFESQNGEMRPREAGRFEVRHVPAAIRERDRIIGATRTPVLKKYERICFEKQMIRLTGKPMADLIHPNHPLMAATTDLVLSAHRSKLKQGAVLVDPQDDGTEPRVLFMVDHSVRESEKADSNGKPVIASRRLQFVAIDQGGNPFHAGWAPHLDLQPIDDCDLKLVKDILQAPWITGDLESMALNHASQHLVPDHYQEVKARRERVSDKIHAAVHERLIKEINYLSGQAIKLDEQVSAGKQPRVQPENFRRRAEELTARLEQRKKELEAMKNVVSSTPVVIGGALVIPQGLLASLKGDTTFCVDAQARARIEQVAMQAVTQHEQALGNTVKDVSADKCGWDITARPPRNLDGSLPQDRHIEVKGRAKGQDVITVSRNEIFYALNQADKFWLAIVVVDGDDYEGPFYVKNPFTKEPDAGVPSVNYEIKHLLSKAEPQEFSQ